MCEIHMPKIALFVLAMGALYATGVHAEVHLPNGEYRTSHTDLRVKVLGGYVTVERTWQAVNVNKGQYRWYLNPAWADLDVVLEDGNGEIKSIGRTGAKFEKQSDDLFVLKEADHAYFIRTIREAGVRTGLRWTDRLGNAIDYDVNGKIVSYNDRNGIMVHFGRDQDGHITEVRDHNHPAPAPALLTWTWAGEKVTAISDYSGRSVQYHYTGDNLTEVIDVLQHPWGYSYVGAAGAALMHTETDAEGRVTTIDYNGNRVWKVTGPVAGATTVYEYTYDRGSRQYTAVETSPEGKHTESTYDADGKLIRQELGTGSNIRVVSRTIKDSATVDIEYDERNLPTRTEYDANRNPIKVTYPDGSTTSATYDGAHSLPLTRTDELGVVTKYEYDTNGNLTTLTEAFGLPEQRVTTNAYDALGQRTTQTVKGETPADDATTTWTYDAYGNVQSATDAENHTTSFAYDVQGNIVKRTDARQKDWFTPTNAAGWVTSQKDPLGHETVITYDKVGNRIAVEDPEHNVTTYRYTPSNQVETVEDPLHGVTTTRYAKDGQRSEETDANGVKMSYGYDTAGRLTTMIDGAGNVTTLIYGKTCDNQTAAGLESFLTATRFPTYCEEYKYDPRGNRTQMIRVLPNGTDSPDRQASASGYDARGHAISFTDPLGRSTQSKYDALGRLSSVTDATGGATVYTYDARDNVGTITDANQHVYRFTYYKANRTKTEARPLGQTVSYGYDVTGNLTVRTNSKGERRQYVYDDAGRRSSEYQFTANSQTPSQTITYTYDGRNLLIGYAQTGDTESGAVFQYDSKGQKINETVTYGVGAGALTKTLAYAYEPNGLRKSLTYPDSTTQTNAYDKNRLSEIMIKGSAIRYEEYQWRMPTRVRMPGATRTLAYDPLQRPTQIKSDSVTGATIMDYRYSYDAAGNIVQRETEDGPYIYVYDRLNRLVGATPPGILQQAAGNTNGLPVEQYTYDPVHNRKTSAHQPGSWIYNANNELNAYGTGADAHAYAYDANGNTVEEMTGDTENPTRTRDFVYNAAERLSEIKDNGITIARYQYDPMGRRFKKETAAGTTWFQYADEGLIAEYASNGTLMRAYGWEPGGLWGTGPVWGADIAESGWALSIYHNDNLNSPQRMTDISGNLTWGGISEAFGKFVRTIGSIANDLALPGQYFDAESSLAYNLNRNYSNGLGRYLEVDPIGHRGGLNFYSYATASPLVKFDNNGLIPRVDLVNDVPVDEDDGAGATIVCNGNGGLIPYIFPRVSLMTLFCIGTCIIEHEMVHIKDYQGWNPSLCKPKVAYPNPVNEPDKINFNNSEINAYTASIKCLEALLKKACSPCKPIVEGALALHKKELEGYESKPH